MRCTSAFILCRTHPGVASTATTTEADQSCCCTSQTGTAGAALLDTIQRPRQQREWVRAGAACILIRLWPVIWDSAALSLTVWCQKKIATVL
jgi:hypothetical protein